MFTIMLTIIGVLLAGPGCGSHWCLCCGDASRAGCLAPPSDRRPQLRMDIGVACRDPGSMNISAAEFATGIPEEMPETFPQKVPAVKA